MGRQPEPAIPADWQSYPFLTCALALPLHNEVYGPAESGRPYLCWTYTQLGGNYLSVVYQEDTLAATYLSQIVFARGTAEDVAVCTLHWRWSPSGVPDESDFETIEDRIRGFWTNCEGFMHTTYSLIEIRWYQADPAVGPPNPAILVTPVTGIQGTNTASALPSQVALTITERTDVRRSWGRIYLPGFSVDQVATDGHAKVNLLDGLEAEVAALFDQSNANWKAVVLTSSGSLQTRAISIDNIWDVQRRRRFETTTDRRIVTL